MEFITSRGYKLPDFFEGMGQGPWFNMWMRKRWPYSELNVNDTLYWYETISGCIVWRTMVIEVDKFPYNNKVEAFKRIRNKFGPFDESQKYCLNAPNSGYCLVYTVNPIERVTLLKPTDLKFPMLGWLEIDRNIFRDWLGVVT